MYYYDKKIKIYAIINIDRFLMIPVNGNIEI